MLAPVGCGENFRLLVLFGVVQCVLSASSSQENESLYDVVEIESD